MSGPLPALHLQTVLHSVPIASVWRSLRGVMSSFAAARSAGLVERLIVYIGDTAPNSMADVEFADLEHLFEGSFAELRYTRDVAQDEGVAHDQLAAALMAECASEYLVVLGGGVYPSPTFLTALLERTNEPTIGIAEGRSLPLEHPKTYDPGTGETDFASLGGALIRRSALAEVGGFDNGAGIGAIGVELSWRLRQAGHRIVHVPRATYFDDLRPGEDGSVCRPEDSPYQGMLDRLLLAHRFAHPQLAADFVHHIEALGDEGQRRALERYRLAESRGELPVPLTGATGGYFVGGHYTATRF